jgi:hypothetical protein
LKAATERATRAEQGLLSLLRSLFPEGKNIYAARHMTLKELALQDLNAILAGLGYEIITRHTGSELAVACRLANGQMAARNVFELRKRVPDGVVDEDAGALSLPEASADGEAPTG